MRLGLNGIGHRFRSDLSRDICEYRIKELTTHRYVNEKLEGKIQDDTLTISLKSASHLVTVCQLSDQVGGTEFICRTATSFGLIFIQLIVLVVLSLGGSVAIVSGLIAGSETALLVGAGLIVFCAIFVLAILRPETTILEKDTAIPPLLAATIAGAATRIPVRFDKSRPKI